VWGRWGWGVGGRVWYQHVSCGSRFCLIVLSLIEGARLNTMQLDSTKSKFRVKKRPACESKGKPPLELEKGKGNGKGKGKRAVTERAVTATEKAKAKANARKWQRQRQGKGKGKGKPPLDNENNTMQLDSTESKLLKRVDADKGLQELIVNVSRKLLPTVLGRLLKSSRFWEVLGGLEDYAKFLTLKVVCNDVYPWSYAPHPRSTRIGTHIFSTM